MVKRISFALVFISLLVISCVLIELPLFDPSFPNPTVEATQIQATEIIQTVETIPLKEIPSTQTPDVVVGKDIPTKEIESHSYKPQTGTPIQTTAWLYGCDWFGVGGQVIDDEGTQLEYYVIEAGGYINGQEIIGLSLVGTDPEYGPGGYEIKFSNQPVDSTESIWIQLKNFDGDNLSQKIFIDTSSECTHNLVLLNFLRNGETEINKSYLPIVIR